MGNTDVSRAFLALMQLESALEGSQAIPHEESEQHRLFCDDVFCLERGPVGEE